jgi:hypothetical protein
MNPLKTFKYCMYAYIILLAKANGYGELLGYVIALVLCSYVLFLLSILAWTFFTAINMEEDESRTI